MNINVVTCATWVPRGVAAAVPEKVSFTVQYLLQLKLSINKF